jgi:putative peptidoglycan lipid II flippase
MSKLTSPDAEKKAVFDAGIILSLGLLLGRAAGLIRESCLASTFGTSFKSDFAILAVTIPDVIINIIVSGGLSAALIPEFKSLSSRSSSSLFVQVCLVVGAVFTLLAILFFFAPHLLLSVFAPGLPVAEIYIAESVISQVVWLIPLSVLSGVSVAFLHSKGAFFIPSMGTLLFNGTLIMGFYLMINESKSLSDFTIFLVLAGVIRLTSQLARSTQYLCVKDVFSHWLLSRALLNRYCLSLASFGLLSLFPAVARALASYGEPGDISKFNFSWKLVELPLGLVVASIVVASYPKLSEQASLGKEKMFGKTMRGGYFLITLLTTSIALFVFFNAEFLVVLVYGWGEGIDKSGLSEISKLLQIGILGLPFQAVIATSSACINAFKKPLSILLSVAPGFCLFCIAGLYFYQDIGLQGLLAIQTMVYGLISLRLFCVAQRVGPTIDGVFSDKLIILPSLLTLALLLLTAFLVQGSALQVVFSLIICLATSAFAIRKRYRKVIELT